METSAAYSFDSQGKVKYCQTLNNACQSVSQRVWLKQELKSCEGRTLPIWSSIINLKMKEPTHFLYFSQGLPWDITQILLNF